MYAPFLAIYPTTACPESASLGLTGQTEGREHILHLLPDEGIGDFTPLD